MSKCKVHLDLVIRQLYSSCDHHYVIDYAIDNVMENDGLCPRHMPIEFIDFRHIAANMVVLFWCFAANALKM